MRKTRLRAPLACGLASALFTLSLAAEGRAAGSDEDAVRSARELFRQAMDDQDARRYDQALDKLRRVAAVKTTPAVQFYISYNEEKLGRLAVAESDMRAAEDELRQQVADTTGQASADAEKLDAFAKNELAALSPRVPHLAVQMDKRIDATLTVDGAPIASSVWTSVAVDPGTHHLIAHGRGLDDARDVTVREGQRLAISFAPASASTADASAAASANTRADADRSSHAKTIATAATAGAVVFLAGGIASYAVAGNDASNARARCAGEVACDPSRGAIRTFDALALTGWIGAAGLASVAIVEWVRAGRESPTSAAAALPSSSPRAALVVGPGNAAIEGTF